MSDTQAPGVWPALRNAPGEWRNPSQTNCDVCRPFPPNRQPRCVMRRRVAAALQASITSVRGHDSELKTITGTPSPCVLMCAGDFAQRSPVTSIRRPARPTFSRLRFGVEIIHRDARARHDVVKVVEQQVLPCQFHAVRADTACPYSDASEANFSAFSSNSSLRRIRRLVSACVVNTPR